MTAPQGSPAGGGKQPRASAPPAPMMDPTRTASPSPPPGFTPDPSPAAFPYGPPGTPVGNGGVIGPNGQPQNAYALAQRQLGVGYAQGPQATAGAPPWATNLVNEQMAAAPAAVQQSLHWTPPSAAGPLSPTDQAAQAAQKNLDLYTSPSGFAWQSLMGDPTGDTISRYNTGLTNAITGLGGATGAQIKANLNTPNPNDVMMPGGMMIAKPNVPDPGATPPGGPDLPANARIPYGAAYQNAMQAQPQNMTYPALAQRLQGIIGAKKPGQASAQLPQQGGGLYG